MRRINLRFIFFFLLSFCFLQKNNFANTVNAIIGDYSFIQTYGCAPDVTTDENLRIKTHLAYVENILRETDVSHLTSTQKAKRIHLLDLLNDYWNVGIFPKNFDYPGQRIPCFIDKDGRICAVGYLIEQTAGRAVAEKINDKFKYHEILSMNDDNVDAWIIASGLTKEECAMIQPTYGPAYWGEPIVVPVDPLPSAGTQPYVWTPIYAGPTKLEVALTKKVDSLLAANDSLQITTDSLDLVIKNQTSKIDSLLQVNKLDNEKIVSQANSLDQKDTNLNWIIGSLISIAGFTALMLIIKQLFWKKVKSV